MLLGWKIFLLGIGSFTEVEIFHRDILASVKFPTRNCEFLYKIVVIERQLEDKSFRQSLFMLQLPLTLMAVVSTMLYSILRKSSLALFSASVVAQDHLNFRCNRLP